MLVEYLKNEKTMADAGRLKCDTAANTLHWINAIVEFLKPYSFLINAHVVNFFKDRLWEAVDKDWMECLRKEPVENLLQIPAGIVQDYWPESLKNYIRTSRSLVFPRAQADLQMVFPDLSMTSLNSVLAQGMNEKKKYEVEIMSAVVSFTAKSMNAPTIVDVGAGQGYLGQVLSFHYRLPTLAIDACSHHGRVTDARAERIKKYYLAQIRKSRSEAWSLNLPKTITCRIMSVDVLKVLADISSHEDAANHPCMTDDNVAKFQKRNIDSSSRTNKESSLVLAGLHACGDLSVIMLRTFLECKEAKAVVSVGCCYNLLSENGVDDTQCGFPMSCGVKSVGISLGKNARDLACQSAERWGSLDDDTGLHNFELHGIRAAFQMILCQYYPEVATTCPSIGRQGKALRRKHQKRTANSHLQLEDKLTESETSACKSTKCDGTAECSDNYSLFEKFSQAGLDRLGIRELQDIDFHGIWKETKPDVELVGPYWSLRAALGPVLETCLLLDRLLFLQEQGSSLEALMLPIFDPEVSPRNVAIIAKKKSTS